MGRRGLVGLFVNKFTTTLRVVGSNPLADFLSFSLLIEECIVSRNEERLHEGNRTCKTRRLKEKRMDGRRRQSNQECLGEMVWLVSKTIKWSTPSKERHGENILTCCYISLVVHKPILVKNET